MAKFENKPFTNEDVFIGGNAYVGCAFTRCRIIYSGGTLPELVRNKFVDTTWVLDGAASRTMAFLNALYHGGGQEVVKSMLNEVASTKRVHEDG